ncbi:MAG: hypothetical protein KAH32_08215 [Chlamydiia bacterium]|nr:hypothetical protein [Chlamydiia bacterium]
MMKVNKKVISRTTIVVGSITIPAAITVGLVYGIKKEDTRLHHTPPTTVGEKFFDSTIASSTSNYASRLIITPSDGHALTELVRLDEELDYENLVPMLKKDADGKINPFYSKIINFETNTTVESIRKKLLKVNSEIFNLTLNSNNRHDNGRELKSGDSKVMVSKGSTRVGIDIRKDLVKREIIVSLFDLVEEKVSINKIADEYIKDIGTIDFSKIKFDRTDPGGFFEIFAGNVSSNRINAISKYFKFNGVKPFEFYDKNGSDGLGSAPDSSKIFKVNPYQDK